MELKEIKMDTDYDKIKKIAVSNRKMSGNAYFQNIDGLKEHGACGLLLREKDLTLTEYFRLADRVRKRPGFSLPMILHTGIRYPDKTEVLRKMAGYVAKYGMAGIHFTGPDFGVYCKHRENMDFGKKILTGVSVHSVTEAEIAEKTGADYLIAGHIFETGCKPGMRPRGTEFLQCVCKQVSIPVYAIGGITKENAALTIQSGAAGICMMSGFFKT